MSTDRLARVQRFSALPLVCPRFLVAVAAVLVLGDSSLHSVARVVATTAIVVGVLCWGYAAVKALRDRPVR